MITDPLAHRSTYVEVDASALRHNLRLLKNAIGPRRKLILVVKSDAYGHGARLTTQIAAEEGITHFAVASVDEGVGLRNAGLAGEILLLHAASAHDVPQVIASKLTPGLSSEGTAQAYSRNAGGGTLDVQAEINTGLSRLGFDWETAADSIARLARLPNLRLTGLFTHYRAHLSPIGDSIQEQSDRFTRVIDQLNSRGIVVPFIHAASSYPAAFHPQTYFDGIRVGVIAYGAIEQCPTPLEGLRPVMSVRSRIMHVRRIRAGDWVHYGDGFQASNEMTIAVIPIGYGMGYPRHLSTIGEMLVRGRRCRIIGVIGMDMTMIDVSELGKAEPGERVTVLGRDGNNEITAVELAERSGTIAYEITCRLGNGLDRAEIAQLRPEGAIT